MINLDNTTQTNKYFKELSSKIFDFVDFYQKNVLLKILNSQDYTTEPKRFFYTVIHKTLSSLDVVNLLTRNFEVKRNYHPPLFILIRAMIADIVVTEYIIWKAQNDEEMEGIINKIYFDHIENIIKSTITASKVYDWSESELNNKRDEEVV